MKILHVLAQLPQRTGSGIYFTNIINGFKGYNDIEQACLYGTTEEYDIDIINKEYQFEVVFQSEKLPFPIVGMSDVMPYRSILYSEMTDKIRELWKEAFTSRLYEIKENFNPDIIISHHLWMLTSIVCDIFKDRKIIGICHNTDLRQAEKNPVMKEKYVRGLERLDKIFSLSSSQKDKIVKIYGYDKNKIIYLGAGYNEKLFYPPEDYKEKKKIELLYVGKYDESKGFYERIKAFKIISEKRDDVTLTLIGAGKDEEREKREEAVKGIRNIQINGFIPQKEMADIMRTKDIFILPSYFEGLGLIAVEALGSGLRAVTTNINGLIELLGDKINNSGVIEYVKMPTIYNVDKAVEEEKPDFIKRLVESIEKQIARTIKNRKIDEEILSEILKNSWKSKIETIYENIR